MEVDSFMSRGVSTRSESIPIRRTTVWSLGSLVFVGDVLPRGGANPFVEKAKYLFPVIARMFESAAPFARHITSSHWLHSLSFSVRSKPRLGCIGSLIPNSNVDYLVFFFVCSGRVWPKWTFEHSDCRTYFPRQYQGFLLRSFRMMGRVIHGFTNDTFLKLWIRLRSHTTDKSQPPHAVCVHAEWIRW